MTPILGDVGTLTVLAAGAAGVLGGAAGSVLASLFSRTKAQREFAALVSDLTAAAEEQKVRARVREQLERERPPVADVIRRAAEGVAPLNFRVSYRIETGPDGRPVVNARVAGAEGEGDVTLSGDQLWSEHSARFQLIDAWSKVLRARSEQLLDGGPVAAGA